MNISIKETDRLANLICMIPVADKFDADGASVNIITRPDWATDLAVLRPNFLWNQPPDNRLIDLGKLDLNTHHDQHRTDACAKMIPVKGPFPSLGLIIPEIWKKPFHPFRGSVIFAPEAGHPSRQWPSNLAKHLAYHLPNQWIILVGNDPKPEIVCDKDFRGKLALRELMGLLSVAKTVITMDSAILHLTAALDVPTVAVFGHRNPDCSVKPDKNVIVLQSQIDCCPCTANDTCENDYACINQIQPEDVVHAINSLKSKKVKNLQKIAPKLQQIA